MPYYYAGYGDLKKGITVAAVLGLFAGVQYDTHIIIIIIGLLLGLVVAIYGGIKAKKELPVKKQKFSWLNVFYAGLAYVAAMMVVGILLLLPGSSEAKCNDIETKNLVSQIALEDFAKEGMEKLVITLSNIQTSKYNKEIGNNIKSIGCYMAVDELKSTQTNMHNDFLAKYEKVDKTTTLNEHKSINSKQHCDSDVTRHVQKPTQKPKKQDLRTVNTTP